MLHSGMLVVVDKFSISLRGHFVKYGIIIWLLLLLIWMNLPVLNKAGTANNDRKRRQMMTIQQMQYVLEIAKTGSVSQAARNLYLSQPNISNSLKALEAELGTPLFQRTSSGMVLTAAGQRLAQRAGGIIQELNTLIKDVQGIQNCHFRLNSSAYLPAFEAFTDLCQKYQDQPNLQFSCFSNQGSDLIQSTLEGQYDLAVFVEAEDQNIDRLCERAGIRQEILFKAQMFVQLSRSHPLVRSGEFSLEALYQYPYVDYTHSKNHFLGNAALFFIDPSKLIRVQSITGRRDVVLNTHAFSVVLPHSEYYNEHYGFVCVPIPGLCMYVGYLCPSAYPLSSFAQDYLEFFKQRLTEIIGGDPSKGTLLTQP